MFTIKINDDDKEKGYAVYGEREFTIITNPTTVFISCPNYYQLNILPGSNPIIQYTNIEPIIIEDNPIKENGFNKFNISFGRIIFNANGAKSNPRIFKSNRNQRRHKTCNKTSKKI